MGHHRAVQDTDSTSRVCLLIKRNKYQTKKVKVVTFEPKFRFSLKFKRITIEMFLVFDKKIKIAN